MDPDSPYQSRTVTRYYHKDRENTTVFVYLGGLGVAIVLYYLLKYFKPDLVMTGTNGTKVFDETRAVVVSILMGVMVLIAFHFIGGHRLINCH